jgi:hypothetical protein
VIRRFSVRRTAGLRVRRPRNRELVLLARRTLERFHSRCAVTRQRSRRQTVLRTVCRNWEGHFGLGVISSEPYRTSICAASSSNQSPTKGVTLLSRISTSETEPGRWGDNDTDRCYSNLDQVFHRFSPSVLARVCSIWTKFKSTSMARDRLALTL